MDSKIFGKIKEKIKSGEYILSDHAQYERLEEDIDGKEIEEAINNGEVLEDYPNDKRGHSCLILGYSKSKAIHVICGMKENKAVIVTVYLPKLPKWVTPKQRLTGGMKNGK